MTMADLGKAAALTIDVDPYDWQGAAQRWGDTRKVRKAAMRAASVAALDDWLTATDLLGMVVKEAAAAGLPAQPNRVLMTGQGYCLIYWLPDAMGWVDGTWSPERMKLALKPGRVFLKSSKASSSLSILMVSASTTTSSERNCQISAHSIILGGPALLEI